ncbi:DUF6527 family protein [Methylophilus sp. UBA6697]|uniref:DUF6527 family protein n=1 Tax=Methylophilus sp. UBA6697 TaxID=1946902 RepID=UPI0025DC400F|nr:DUF6527 family protein [Methylophilus sp. UBA6697]
MKINYLQPEYVVSFPDQLKEGVLYISEEYASAAHACCCGCGEEVLTPLKPSKWHLSKSKNGVSLHPSIGNWKFDCQSHYWIKENRVLDAGKMSRQRIEAVKAKDKVDNRRYIAQKNSATEAIEKNSPKSLPSKNLGFFSKMIAKFRNWLIGSKR